METDKIKALWKKGKQLNNVSGLKNRSELEQMIRTRSAKTGKKLLDTFKMAMGFLLVGVVLHTYNMLKFWGKQDMLALSVIANIILLGTLFYTYKMHVQFLATSKKPQSLKEALLLKVTFYKQKYNLWLLSYSFSFIVILVGANMVIGDYEFPLSLSEGYPLYIINSIGFLIVYFSYRFLNTQYLKEYKSYLLDLESDSITDLKALVNKYRRIKILLGLCFFMLALLGVVVFFMVKSL